VIKKAMRGTGHVARMSEVRKYIQILVAKPDGEKSLGVPRLRYK
jgi:hypothetical protein